MVELLESRLTPADLPPTAALTVPLADAIVSGSAADFAGTGSDDIGTVRAEFFIDGVLRSTDSNTTGTYRLGGAPGRFDTTALTNGPHQLRMVVYDTVGQSAAAQADVIVSNVTPLQLASFNATDSGFAVRFNRVIDHGVLNLVDVENGDLGPADATLTGASVGSVRGSLVLDADGRGLTFVRTGGLLAPDTYTVRLRSAGSGFRDVNGVLLDGNGDATTGDDYLVTFTVSASNRALTLPDFARGPGQAINVPASGTGLTLRLSDGMDVTSVSLTLNYDPALLDILSATALPAGAAASLTFPSAGVANLTITRALALPAGALDLVRLDARIPAMAPYGAAGVIRIGNLSINAGAIAGLADTAVQVVAFPGDTTANGLYSSADAQRALRVAVGRDGGLLNYPLLDPAIVTDLNSNGRVDSADATLLLQRAVGQVPIEIPSVPASVLPTITVRASDTRTAETGGPKTFVVARTGSLSAALVVNYTAAGRATNGSDYSFLPGSVTLPAGSASTTISISPLNDLLPEGPETVTLALNASGAYTLGGESTATILLTDDDSGSPTNYSLRFFGNGVNDIDRIKIALDAPERPVDVGGTDFTLEFFLKTTLADVTGTVSTGNDGWITGNIVLDRDVWGPGDFGDFGVSLGRVGQTGVVAFGVNNGSTGATVVGTRQIADGSWHHVAVTRRRSDGLLSLFVDGALDGSIDGPDGDVSYRNNRTTGFANDPFLVIGAEKHDAGTAYPSYRGWLDEVRISNVLRYTGAYTRPQGSFSSDGNTVGLYHFDENGGTSTLDSSGAPGGPSDGELRQGGAPVGPVWTTDSPFAERVTFGVIGDFSAGQAVADVSTLIKSWNPDFVATLGDNNYSVGAASTIDPNIGQYFHEFIYPYLGSYGAGATVNRFLPSLGNHDWDTASATPYLDYFTLPGNERYYEAVWGPVHLFVVDSDPREPDGNTRTSVQAQWLKARLAASNAAWKVVTFHHPPFSSGANHGNAPNLDWPYQEWGADLVLSGHDHTYERFQRYDFPYVVDGLGGRSLYQFDTPEPGSQVRYSGDYGALRVDANRETLTLQFINRSGQVIDTHTLTHSLVPVVSVVASDARAAESGGNPATYSVSRTGYTDQPLTVNYTLGGTAVNGVDYALLSGSVIIPAGASSAAITLTPLADAQMEGTDTVVLTLGAGSGYQVGVTSTATVLLFDVDPTLVAAGAVWRYLDNGSNQGTAWRNPGFNDSAWASGPATLGYGGNGESTVVSFGPDANNKYITTYFRRTFTVTDLTAFGSLLLRVRRDDGAVVYLNGVEVFRTNMPTGTITSTTLASAVVSGANESAFFQTTVSPNLLVNGVNTLAVEVHQANVTSSDVSFNLELQGVI